MKPRQFTKLQDILRLRLANETASSFIPDNRLWGWTINDQNRLSFSCCWSMLSDHRFTTRYQSPTGEKKSLLIASNNEKWWHIYARISCTWLFSCSQSTEPTPISTHWRRWFCFTNRVKKSDYLMLQLGNGLYRKPVLEEWYLYGIESNVSVSKNRSSM